MVFMTAPPFFIFRVHVQDSEMKSAVSVNHIKDGATRSVKEENWPTSMPKQGKSSWSAFKQMFLKRWKSWGELREACDPGTFFPIDPKHGDWFGQPHSRLLCVSAASGNTKHLRGLTARRVFVVVILFIVRLKPLIFAALALRSRHINAIAA
jgi:hypothetical protein